MRKIGLAAILFALSVGSIYTATKEEERLANAAKAFDEIMSAPDKGIPGGVLEKADCIVIIPGMKKGGFILGGRYGKGLVSCRNKEPDRLGSAGHAGDGWRQCRPPDWRLSHRCGDAGDGARRHGQSVEEISSLWEETLQWLQGRWGAPELPRPMRR